MTRIRGVTSFRIVVTWALERPTDFGFLMTSAKPFKSKDFDKVPLDGSNPNMVMIERTLK